MLRFLSILVLALSLVGCGKHQLDKDPHQHVFANGDKLIIAGSQASWFNKRGQLLQQSTFSSPTFLEARSFLIDMQQDLVAKHYSDFLQGDISYPLRVNRQGKSTIYNNSEQLQAKFTEVFTNDILNAMIHQDPFRLFANDQGIMFANGKVWFNKQGVFAINH